MKGLKELINKSCRLTIILNDKQLYYTVKEVMDIDETHISFIDKFNKKYTYRLVDIIQIQDVK